MRRGHFEALAPCCPRCRADGAGDQPLRLSAAPVEERDIVVEGILRCSSEACQREFPIIDGIPILVPDPAALLADQVHGLLDRGDLSDTLESVVGDCLGPGSAWDTNRQHLSLYCYGHYADLDPDEEDGEGPLATLWGEVRRTVDLGAPERVIDLGCSVGRTAFELAAAGAGLVLGADMNLSMLRVAQHALRRGLVRYPRRRLGLVYDRREFPVRFDGMDRVDFWACDVHALPLGDRAMPLATALNVLDCVRSPLEFLAECGRILAPGGRLAMTSPYDWSGTAAPAAAWLGGHSQRSEYRGESAAFVRDLLTPGGHPGHAHLAPLRLETERDDLPWRVRIHDRSVMQYRVHLMTAVREGEPPRERES